MMLNLARKEIPIVLKKIRAKMPWLRSRPLSAATLSEILNFWLDTPFLNCMVDHINSLLQRPISGPELEGFIRVELLLQFFGTSPDQFFKTSLAYAPSTEKMSETRYREIVNALSKHRTHTKRMLWQKRRHS